MNFYTVAFTGMPSLLLEAKASIKEFQRDVYPKAFKRYYENHLVILEALENGYNSAVDKETYINNMATELVDSATKKIDAESKRGQKETLLLDFNLSLAIYVYPAILEFNGAVTPAFKESLIQKWKECFPKTSVQAADFETINKGFKRKFCYITTAVCETFGKEDSCYELTLLREYRDDYLEKQPQGAEIINEYYDLAPSIVKHINQREESEQIYAGIWQEYLEPCIQMIEQGEKKACKGLYVKMVRDLQKQYFLS